MPLGHRQGVLHGLVDSLDGARGVALFANLDLVELEAHEVEVVLCVKKRPTELPALEGRTLLEASWIWWGSRLMDSTVGFKAAPFRAPHHTVSEAGLVGGVGKRVMPGEVSLAHGGCLVLDELPEFRKSCVERVGQALRAGEVRLGETALPTRPSLVCATASVCPCGYLGTPRPCVCKGDAIVRWVARMVEYAQLLGVKEILPVLYPAFVERNVLVETSGSMSPKEVLDGLKDVLESSRRA